MPTAAPASERAPADESANDVAPPSTVCHPSHTLGVGRARGAQALPPSALELERRYVVPGKDDRVLRLRCPADALVVDQQDPPLPPEPARPYRRRSPCARLGGPSPDEVFPEGGPPEERSQSDQHCGDDECRADLRNLRCTHDG
jgi:hypothetical protein